MSILTILNRLLPFATPGTPLEQDILHLAGLCALLYFAPQIQARLQQRGSEAGPNNEFHEEIDADVDAHDDHLVAQENEHPLDGHAEPQAGRDDDHPIGREPDVPLQRNDPVEDEQAGPARAPYIPEQRNVGAKKAKALARRDQRRAYHEFQRSQGDAQRARDAEGAEEREKTQAAEKERRKAAEATLEARKTKERDERRAKEEAQRAVEQRRREQAVELVRSRLDSDHMCDLFRVASEVGVDDEEWVERIVKASGLVGQQQDVVTMITDVGWAVRISAQAMQQAYDEVLEDAESADEDGLVKPERLAQALQKAVAAA